MNFSRHFRYFYSKTFHHHVRKALQATVHVIYIIVGSQRRSQLVPMTEKHLSINANTSETC